MSNHPKPIRVNLSRVERTFYEVTAAYLAGVGTWSVTDPGNLLELTYGNPLYSLEYVYLYQFRVNGEETEWKLFGRSCAGFYIYVEADRPVTGFAQGGGGEIAMLGNWCQANSYLCDWQLRDALGLD